MDCASWCSQIQANCPIIMWNQCSVKHLLDNEYHCTHFDNSVHSSLIQALLVWSHTAKYVCIHISMNLSLLFLQFSNDCVTITIDHVTLTQTNHYFHCTSSLHSIPLFQVTYILHTINIEYQTAVNSDQTLRREHCSHCPLFPPPPHTYSTHIQYTYQPAPAPVPLSPPQRGC